jgi:hypothetical protein
MLGAMLARASLIAATLVAAGCSTPQAPAADTPRLAAQPGIRAVHRPRVVVKAPPSSSARAVADEPEDKPDPAAQKLFAEKMGQQAVPLASTTSPPRVTAIALDDTRRGEAPGMESLGEIHTATLGEGQRAMMPVRIAPSQCVTFVAQGGLGVIEVDLFLTAGEGTSARILAEDPATGPIAVIGGHGKCFKSGKSGPLDATLNAVVRRGSGVILVRGFGK